MTEQLVHATTFVHIHARDVLSELRVATSPVIDLAAGAATRRLQGALFRSIEQLRKDPLAARGIAAEIKKLREKIPSGSSINTTPSWMIRTSFAPRWTAPNEFCSRVSG